MSFRCAQTVGRVAQRVAQLLSGKGSPAYNRIDDLGDRVTIVNAAHVQFTGRRWARKVYRHHSGYPGGLKEVPARVMLDKHPTLILRRAILGMIKHNKHRVPRMDRLSVWPEEAPPEGRGPRGGRMAPTAVAAALGQRRALQEELQRAQSEALTAEGALPELTDEAYEALQPVSPVIRQRWQEQTAREAAAREAWLKAEEEQQRMKDKQWREAADKKKMSAKKKK